MLSSNSLDQQLTHLDRSLLLTRPQIWQIVAVVFEGSLLLVDILDRLLSYFQKGSKTDIKLGDQINSSIEPYKILEVGIRLNNNNTKKETGKFPKSVGSSSLNNQFI